MIKSPVFCVIVVPAVVTILPSIVSSKTTTPFVFALSVSVGTEDGASAPVISSKVSLLLSIEIIK